LDIGIWDFRPAILQGIDSFGQIKISSVKPPLLCVDTQTDFVVTDIYVRVMFFFLSPQRPCHKIDRIDKIFEFSARFGFLQFPFWDFFMRSPGSLCLIKSAITGQRVSPENRLQQIERLRIEYSAKIFDRIRLLLRPAALASTAATNRSTSRKRPSPRRQIKTDPLSVEDKVLRRCLL
jgi:hypothetical protein